MVVACCYRSEIKEMSFWRAINTSINVWGCGIRKAWVHGNEMVGISYAPREKCMRILSDG